MIMHASLWKFKPGTPPAVVERVVREWRLLKEKISAIRHMAVGGNIGSMPDNYSVAACVQFEAIDGYREYVENEHHMNFARTYLLPNINGLEDRAAVQFEMD
jgi:hypothetical protein